MFHPAHKSHSSASFACVCPLSLSPIPPASLWAGLAPPLLLSLLGGVVDDEEEVVPLCPTLRRMVDIRRATLLEPKSFALGRRAPEDVKQSQKLTVHTAAQPRLMLCCAAPGPAPVSLSPAASTRATFHMETPTYIEEVFCALRGNRTAAVHAQNPEA